MQHLGLIQKQTWGEDVPSVLIGSRAIKYHFHDFREPNDIDYFSDRPIKGAETFWHPDLAGTFGPWGFQKEIATPNELYTIKVSHSFWEQKNGSWRKHMADIMFLKKKGCALEYDLYDHLYSVWEQHYGKKKVNLNADPKDFFNGNVFRLYDHDSIHRSVAYYDRPLFESVLKDGHSVAVDTHKFNMLDFQDKLRLVREEAYATALERQLIPNDYLGSPTGAYAWAIRKIITSFWKGDWALWVVEHFDELLRPDVDYVGRHLANKNILIPEETVA